MYTRHVRTDMKQTSALAITTCTIHPGGSVLFGKRSSIGTNLMANGFGAGLYCARTKLLFQSTKIHSGIDAVCLPSTKNCLSELFDEIRSMFSVSSREATIILTIQQGKSYPYAPDWEM